MNKFTYIGLKLKTKYFRLSYIFTNRFTNSINKNLKKIVSLRDLRLICSDKRYEYFVEMYLSHRFNLLGSGWVKNSYDLNPLGIDEVKYTYLNLKMVKDDKSVCKLLPKFKIKQAEEIRKYISECYEPIDWSRDYKSGFRWANNFWFKKNPLDSPRGGDIKVPWELARLQHLPQLAIYAIEYPNMRKKLLLEIRNQFLDFISVNPNYYGVNWANAMEVAIRSCNILVTIDIISNIDSDNIISHKIIEFINTFIQQSKKYIIHNLEFSANHYLANLVGLIFICCYTENSNNNKMLSFAVNELILEVDKQFYDDGGNYESSTSYHRLSVELVLYGTAIVLGLSKERKIECFNNIDPFPYQYIDKLHKACLFMHYLRKENGEIPQFGDNDNGRLFVFSRCGVFLSIQQAEEKYLNLSGYSKLIEKYVKEGELYWDEKYLDPSSILAAANGLFDDVKFSKYGQEYPIENEIIKSLANNKKLAVNNSTTQLLILERKAIGLPYKREQCYYKQECNSLKDNLRYYIFRDSGVYIYKSDNFFLAVNATPNGQNGNGGHSHNDKLSFELQIEGKDIIIDSGTYTYSAFPKIRDQFRSEEAHNVIKTEIAQNDFPKLFGNSNSTSCELIYYTEYELIVKLAYKEVIQNRHFLIEKDKVKVIDYSNLPILVNQGFTRYSNGYGNIIKR